ncbi:unnamed protein product [Anisakis simplex]|uniref:C-mannosyltransferase dpy-19 (inferred by orthology to a C. elegans protein) n=1 Tax=Anisakis simplex TaxID=6269 RepID=A0A0M3JZ11_ANISI|nr:unnamed protein product [Anisakis simplex]
MFENDRHFSHLADFEREMAYRTEMVQKTVITAPELPVCLSITVVFVKAKLAFVIRERECCCEEYNNETFQGLYYSYYKTIITAPSFSEGLYEITHDNVTEYGHTINCLKRFNLYPEVILGAAYRVFMKVVRHMKWNVETCWQVNRGDSLPPVNSCEVLGGLLAVCCFFFNHGEATRVQWTPPLRESFGYPVFILQILVVTYFAAFALSTQVGSLFATFILDFIPTRTIRTIVYGHIIGFVVAFVLLFGNEMLLTSLFLSSVLTFMGIIMLDSALNRIRFRPLYLLINSVLFIIGTLGIKLAIGSLLRITDDAHIFDILRSKFSDFANFHTRLYTCAREFDFLGTDFLAPVSMTLLLPAAVVSAQLLLTYMARFELSSFFSRNGSKDKPFAEFVSLAIGRNISINLHRIILVALVAAMAFQGVQNVEKQLSIQGEYSNPEQEMLFNWISQNTKPGIGLKCLARIRDNLIMQRKPQAVLLSDGFYLSLLFHVEDEVFAGTMPVMANVKLSTNRAIVNHPHYEDAGLRTRTMKVYSMYSKKPLMEVYRTLKSMGVNYFIYQPESCRQHPTKPECSYRAIWDLEDPSNVSRQSLCDIYHIAFSTRDFTLIEPFKVLYVSPTYVVFKL